MVRRLLFPLLLVTATLSFPADTKRKQPKPPELEVVSATLRRADNGISADGKVKNSGLRPLTKVLLVFELLSPDRKVVASRRGTIDAELLQPGDEAEFSMQMPDAARSVEVRIEAFDGRQRELEVANNGPFIIE